MKNGFYIGILLFSCIVSAIAQVLLKKASHKNYSTLISQYLNLFVIAGYFLFFVVVIVNIWLLKFVPISIISPIAESFPLILTFLAGKFFFGEKITCKKVIGVVCIVMGIVIVLI